MEESLLVCTIGVVLVSVACYFPWLSTNELGAISLVYHDHDELVSPMVGGWQCIYG